MKQKLTLMLLAFCATFAFAATQGQRRADGNSLLIKFTEKVDAGSLANTYSDGEFVLTRTADTNNKHAIDENSAYFGTAESYVKFDYRFKTGGKSGSSNSLQLTIPAAGTLKVYARTGSNSATDRYVVLTQDGAELYNAVVKEADAVQVQMGDNLTNVYPVISAEVKAGTVDITYPTNSINFYGFELATAGEEAGPKNIEISPESGSDIGAVLAAEVEGIEKIGNITINLAENGEYTIGQSIVASQSLVINGNGAVIYATDLENAFIALNSSPTAAFLPKSETENTDYYGIEKISITGIKVLGLKRSIFYDNSTKYCVVDFTIDNCVFSLETESVDNEALISFKAGGAKDFTIKNSTVYGNNAVAKYFIRYNNSARLDRYGFNKDKEFETFTYTNNTFYGLLKSDGQWGNYDGMKGQKYTAFDVKKNIWMNCGENKIAQRMLGGRNASAYKNCTFENNTYAHVDEGSMLVFESEGTDAVKEDGETLVATYDTSKTALLTDPYFRDPVNGDFALESSSDQAKKGTGDQRWGTWTASGTEFEITIGESENGTVTVDNPNAVEGTEVTITATPAEGYVVDVITVKDIDGNEITVTDGKFIMPAKAVTVTVTFKLSTGISNISADKSLEGAVFYNLNGQRVEKPGKGLYIVNGKKVVIK